MKYSADWHHALLATVDGVSLEKMALNLESVDSSHWHSASASSGFATPGNANSQLFGSLSHKNDFFSLANRSFSPNQDGYRDFLQLDFSLDDAGYMLRLDIFDLEGRLFRQLAHNHLLGEEESIYWDGLGDDEEIGRNGIYILKGTIGSSKWRCTMPEEELHINLLIERNCSEF